MEVELAVTRLGEKSVTFGYKVWRAADGEQPRQLAAEGQSTSAIVDLREFRAVAMPARVRALLAELVVPGAEPAAGPGGAA
jgi:acyl-CoA thioesterase FadM